MEDCRAVPWITVAVAFRKAFLKQDGRVSGGCWRVILRQVNLVDLGAGYGVVDDLDIACLLDWLT